MADYSTLWCRAIYWPIGAWLAWRGGWWALGVVLIMIIEAFVADRLIFWQKEFIRLLQEREEAQRG